MTNNILIVGLGNPGTEYQKTRHNVGFLVLDELQKRYGFSEFTLSKKHTSLVSEGFLGSAKEFLDRTKVVLAKPQTFMNNSGKAVKSLLPKLGLGILKPSLVIIHDDIDIPLGKIKISENRGSAGHRGVDSIIQTLGTKNFTRIRIGIRPAKGKPNNTESFVLKPFLKAELPLLESAIEKATTLLLPLIQKGAD